MIETKKRKRDSQVTEGKEISFMAGIFRNSKRQRQNKLTQQLESRHSDREDSNNFCIGRSSRQKRQSFLIRRFSKRFSKQVMKSKMKKFQDYSLPSRSAEYLKSLDSTLGYFSDKVNTDFLNFSASLDGRLSADSFLSDAGSDKEAVVELHQKIEDEIEARERITKTISDSSNPVKLLEEANSLLLSSSRVLACMKEIYVLQSGESEVDKMVPGKGRLCISGVRLPLMWKNTDHFKNQGDHRRYAVFCLIGVGAEVYSTSLVKNVDRKMTDITFDDVIVFEEVPHDFKVHLDVFCHMIHDDLSNASAPLKIKKKLSGLSSSIGRRFGKTLSGLSSSDITGNAVLGPKFQLIAKGTLSLADVDPSIATRNLELLRQENTSCDLPLFDQYCCGLSVQPSYMMETSVCGFLSIQGESLSGECSIRHWCELKGTTLNGWTTPEQRSQSEPDVVIPVLPDTRVRRKCGQIQPRNVDGACTQVEIRNDDRVYNVCADTDSDTDHLWGNLEQHLLNQRSWNAPSEANMEMFETSLRRTPLNSTTISFSSSHKHRRQRSYRRRLNYSQLNETLEMLLEDDCDELSRATNNSS